MFQDYQQEFASQLEAASSSLAAGGDEAVMAVCKMGGRSDRRSALGEFVGARLRLQCQGRPLAWAPISWPPKSVGRAGT